MSTTTTGNKTQRSEETSSALTVEERPSQKAKLDESTLITPARSGSSGSQQVVLEPETTEETSSIEVIEPGSTKDLNNKIKLLYEQYDEDRVKSALTAIDAIFAAKPLVTTLIAARCMGIFPALLAAMENYSYSMEIQELSLLLLRKICDDFSETVLTTMIELDVIDTVYQLMKENLERPKLQEHGFKLLNRLIKSNANALAMQTLVAASSRRKDDDDEDDKNDNDGLDIFAAAMDQHKEEEEIQKVCCEMIQHIIKHDRHNQIGIRSKLEKATIPKLADIMVAHAKGSDLYNAAKGVMKILMDD